MHPERLLHVAPVYPDVRLNVLGLRGCEPDTLKRIAQLDPDIDLRWTPDRFGTPGPVVCQVQARCEIPAGVFGRSSSMIAKNSCTIAIKSLRQEKTLRDHGETGEAVGELNPEI